MAKSDYGKLPRSSADTKHARDEWERIFAKDNPANIEYEQEKRDAARDES